MNYEYDKAIKSCDPGLAIKEKFYQSYIKPLLKKNPTSGGRIDFFLHQAYLAWRLKIDKNDIKTLKFVEYLCEDLAKKHEVEFAIVNSSIVENRYDTGIRTEQGERNLYESKSKGNLESIFSDQVRLYKILFENEFRLWVTIPYYYLCKNYGIKSKVKDPNSFMKVGASEKFQAIQNIKITLPQGNFQNLIRGFDNQIRNAGEGHDRWEITDKNTLILPIIHPQTGQETKKIELSQKELNGLIKLCRKTIWILKTGWTVFLENSGFEAKFERRKVYKIKEIEENLRGFAGNRWFEIKHFKLNNERATLDFSIKYDPEIVGEKSALFFSSGEKYDLINKEYKTKYHYQMLDIMKYCLCFLDENNPPKTKIAMYDEKDKNLGVVEYESLELKKFLDEKKQYHIPKPSHGVIPDKECKFIIQIKVPYGTRKFWEKFIKHI